MESRNNASLGYKAGLMHGLAIGMGYLSVSFTFGVIAISMGLNWWQAFLISLTNLTSAGQVAGVSIMTAGGSLAEMVISQLVINVRYSLMSVSLSQKADSSMNKLVRAFLAFGITDEIFGVAVSRDSFGRRYMLGLMTLPVIGWTLGTLGGALLGSILPKILIDSLSIGIYGMFIAIVIPVTLKSKRIALICLIAIAISCAFTYIKALSAISGGFAIIISAVIAAAVGAFILPLEKEEASDA